MHRMRVRVVEDVLDANNTIARANRDDFDRHGVTRRQPDGRARAPARRPCSSGARRAMPPGADRRARGRRRRARSTPTGWPACTCPSTQINTEAGFGGECHLDANMVRSALSGVPLDEIDLLLIENVGNLVCPAEFRVGEDARVMVTSVTEGEDKSSM